MKRLLFLLLASILVLSACGNEEEKKEPEKETKSKEKKVDKKEKEVVEKQKQSDKQPQSQEQTNEQNQQMQQQTQNYAPQEENSTPYSDNNTVTEYYNGQSHTTTNNPVRDNYDSGETDPIYEHEYKHFYTPEEAQRAKEESDRILIEDGLEPGHYE
ncbi:hypothetical protein NZL48_001431 [Staphylococcus pseudintermedius]|nr:hypothetical protein [Staphylococcus pseudintermedius]HAR5691247.1 hypothetical protein [Staphylococcus pseudintermedius]